MKKRNNYKKPRLTVRTIKPNFFYNRRRYYDSMDNLLNIDVIASTGGGCGGSASSSENVCLLHGTKIHTPNGRVFVEELSEHDEILVMDLDTNTTQIAQIESIITHYRSSYYEINNTLRITGDHPVWIPNRKKWQVVECIKHGDSVLGYDQSYTHVTSIDKKYEDELVYNIVPNQKGKNTGYFADFILVGQYGLSLASQKYNAALQAY